jgi:hypothetical protein
MFGVVPRASGTGFVCQAKAEDLTEPDKAFTTANRVGWLLKRQRFKRPDRKDERARLWEMTREEIVMAASAYGVEAEPATAI